MQYNISKLSNRHEIIIKVLQVFFENNKCTTNKINFETQDMKISFL